MIPRYSRPELTEIWSDEYKFARWLDVEIALVEAWAEEGIVPRADAAKIVGGARIDVGDILRYIDETHHDMTAFLRSVADSLGPESRWVHYGVTSNDVWDTATSLQMVAALDVLTKQLEELQLVISRRALEHKDTVCIGRTHGVHAEPLHELAASQMRLVSSHDAEAMYSPPGLHAREKTAPWWSSTGTPAT